MKLVLEDVAGRPAFMVVIQSVPRIFCFVINAAEPQGHVSVIQLSKLLIGVRICLKKRSRLC